MAKINDRPRLSDNGFIKTETGLIVPPGYISQAEQRRQDTILQRTYSGFTEEGFAYGLRLNRDPDTMVIKWARKGSGMDDLINQALADGTIANAGISPVVFPQLTALIKRRQSQVLTASLTVTGKKTPAKNARDAISRFNDSPLGAVDAVRQIMYHLDVYNRGAPIATCPITYPVSEWSGYGMKLRSFGDKGNRYWLEVDWTKHGTPIPFLPDVFALEPTGNMQFPYWYRTLMDNEEIWVLLHETQILSLLPSWTGQPGIGTSAVYTCLGFLGEHVLVIDERYEKMIDNLSDGVLLVSGVPQSAKQIRNHIEATDPDEIPGTGTPSRGWTIMATPTTGASVDHFGFRQPDGVDFQLRKGHFEDILALAFEETLSAIVIRGGVGYGVQADTAAENVADSGVFAVLQGISIALSKIYPRLLINIGKTNDRARSLSLRLLNQFASSMASLPEGTLSTLEMRAIINRDVLTIPAIADENIIAEAANEDDAGEIESIAEEADKDVSGDKPTPTGKDASGKPSVGSVEPQKGKDKPKKGVRQKTEPMSVILEWRKHLEAIDPQGKDADLTASDPNPKSVRAFTFYQDYPEYQGMFDAEIDDSDDIPEANEEQPDDAWKWMAGYLLFVNEHDGSGVDRTDALNTRDDFAEIRAAKSANLARLVASGQMTVSEWQRQMERLTQEAIVQQFWLGRGGKKTMTPSDWQWLDGYVRKQFQEIEYLANQLAIGMYSEAQLSNHGGNMIRRSRAGYEAGNIGAHGIGIGRLPAMPGDGSTKCMGGCHCYWTHHFEDGDWVGSTWNHPRVAQPKPGWEPCRDCEYRINTWSPWIP